MSIINELFSNKRINNIEKRGKSTLVDVEGNKYVVKKKEKDIKSIYEYLDSRSFDYYPKIVIDNDDYNIYEYVNDVVCDKEEKALDLIQMLSILHTKTTYYKDMDIDEYKKIYEDILYIINNTCDYYNNLMERIEINVFMSPSYYLIARNISKINSSINYALNTLNDWYDNVKTSSKKRVVCLYNNIDINHIIKNKDMYLINWDKSYIDSPIYDLYNYYNKYYLCFDFVVLFNEYEKMYPLNDEEKKLLYVLISIPPIYIFDKEEIDNTKNIKRIIERVYKSEIFIDKTS